MNTMREMLRDHYGNDKAAPKMPDSIATEALEHYRLNWQWWLGLSQATHNELELARMKLEAIDAAILERDQLRTDLHAHMLRVKSMGERCEQLERQLAEAEVWKTHYDTCPIRITG